MFPTFNRCLHSSTVGTSAELQGHQTNLNVNLRLIVLTGSGKLNPRTLVKHVLDAVQFVYENINDLQ